MPDSPVSDERTIELLMNAVMPGLIKWSIKGQLESFQEGVSLGIEAAVQLFTEYQKVAIDSEVVNFRHALDSLEKEMQNGQD